MQAVVLDPPHYLKEVKYIYDAFKRSAIPLADRMGTTSLKKYSTTK